MRKAVTIQLETDYTPTPVSAYDEAVDNGYEGTEEQYAKEMATIPPTQEEFDAIPDRMFKLTNTTEKATSHHIADSADYAVVDFGMEGKTEQETTEGKNLYSGGDISGTQNAGAAHKYPDLKPIPAGTYTFSANVETSDTDSSTCLVLVYYEDGTIGPSIVVSRGTRVSKSFTLTKTMSSFTCYAGGNNALSVDDTFSFTDIQIEPGSVATDYEPYTGGAPSPNPDYPQEIVNAGKLGKNLWNAEYASNIKNWGTVSYRYIAIPVKKGATVSVSYAKELSEGLGFYCCIGKAAGTVSNVYKWMYHTSSSSNINNSFTFTAEDDVIYVNLAGTTEAFMENINYDLQIELSDAPTEYEPYRYEIGCCVGNKNLWDVEYASDANNWRVPTNGYPYIPIKVIKNSTITISYTNILSAGLGIYACASKVDSEGDTANTYAVYGWMYHSSNVSLSNNSLTFTALSDEIYICLGNGNKQSVVDLFMEHVGNDLQIEIADAPTELELHQSTDFTLTSPVPITKWDYLTKRDGVWGWSIWSEEYVITGNETFIIPSDQTVYAIGASTNMFLVVNDMRSVTPINGLVYCSELRYRNQIWAQSNGEIGLCNNYNQIHMRFPNILLGVSDDATMAEKQTAYKAYLKKRYTDGNPVKLLYQTAEEQAFHPLPEAEQTLLNNLETYYGVTNLYNDQGCPMWLTYVQDSTTRLENIKTNIANLKTAIVALGGTV